MNEQQQQPQKWHVESLRRLHQHVYTNKHQGGSSSSELEERKRETARASELGPRLAGYLEMNPLFLVRREDHSTTAGGQSPEVVIIPLSPESSSPPPQTRSRGLSCCRSQRKLFIVPVFVIANVIVFIVTMYKNNCPASQSPYKRCILPGLKRFSFEPLVQNPLLGPSSQTLLDMGGLESELVTSGQGWRLITCIWLHAGVFHLLLNMLGLLSLGLQMENEFGFFKVGAIYILAGFGGSLLSALFLRLVISVGASGALFGLMGALLSELLINWSQHERNWFLLSQLLVLLIINLALGRMPHVDNCAHIGGCISGFLLGFVLLQQPQLSWSHPLSPPSSPAAGTVPAPGIPVQQDATGIMPSAPSAMQDYDPGPQFVQYQHRLQQQFQERSTTVISFPRYKFVIWVLALNLLIVLYLLALIMLFRGIDVRQKCKWCRQLF